MESERLERQKKIFGCVLLVLIALFWVWFLFFTPVSPLLGGLREGASVSPLPAPGIWGKIGFYQRTADNGFTYFLMAMFFSMAVYKIIRTSFFPGRNHNRLTNNKERRLS